MLWVFRYATPFRAKWRINRPKLVQILPVFAAPCQDLYDMVIHFVISASCTQFTDKRLRLYLLTGSDHKENIRSMDTTHAVDSIILLWIYGAFPTLKLRLGLTGSFVVSMFAGNRPPGSRSSILFCCFSTVFRSNGMDTLIMKHAHSSLRSRTGAGLWSRARVWSRNNPIIFEDSLRSIVIIPMVVYN